MPAHHKRSKDPGDNKEMMQARRRFSKETTTIQCVKKWLDYVRNTQKVRHQLLDIGCGEGYYTDQVQQSLFEQDPQATVFGLDISKVAIRYASKRYPNCQFSVASSHRLPFADQSLDAILRIYAPCKAEELQRVIKDNGVVITVTPAGRHLYQFRERIYQEVRLHNEEPENIEGFELEHQQS